MIFRPSALVTLQIRFDTRPDSAAARALNARVRTPRGAERPDRARTTASGPLPSLDALDRAERALNAQRSSLPPEEYLELRQDLREQRERVLRGETTSAGEAPEALSAGPDDRVVLTGILSPSCEIQRNGLTTADTATIELDYADAPFDPRTIRSAAVELVVGVVGPDEYARGARGETRADGELRSVVPRQGEGGAAPGTTRFVGIVDSWRGTLDGDSDDRVILTCRDLTAMLLDTQLPRGASVDLTQPLDRGVADFLDLFPGLRGFTVVYGVDGEEPIVPADAMPTVRRTGGRRARRVPRAAEMSVWDYLSDLAVSLGLVATLEDYTIRFVRARTFFASRSTSRRMVYGRNLERLEYERKIGGVKTPTIEVRALDPVLGRTRWARHPVRGGQPTSGVYPDTPPRPSRAETLPPSSAGAEDKILTFPVSGFTDPVALERAAETIWQQIARQEVELQIETADVSSYGVDPLEADLLTLRAGDAVELLIASQDANDVRENLVTSGVLEGLSVAARARYLTRLGYNPDVAERLATLQEDANALTVYRVDEVSIRFSTDDGISVAISARNFLVVDEQTTPAADGASLSRRGLRGAEAPLRFGINDPATERMLEWAQEQTAQLQAESARITDARADGSMSEEEYQVRSDALVRQSRIVNNFLRGGGS